MIRNRGKRIEYLSVRHRKDKRKKSRIVVDGKVSRVMIRGMRVILGDKGNVMGWCSCNLKCVVLIWR